VAIIEAWTGHTNPGEAVAQAVRSARLRHGSCVVVTGGPGDGKSHFLRRMARAADGDAVTLVVPCALTGSTPFAPWRDLLEQTRRTLHQGLLGSAGLAPARPRTARDHADRLLALWSTADRPVLVLLDDADTMDGASSQVLELLIDDIGTEAVALVLTATADHEVSSTWSPVAHRSGDIPSARLGPMRTDEVVTLLRALDPVTSEDLIHQAGERLVTQCAGHPLAITARLRRAAQHMPPGEVVAAVLDAPPLSTAPSGAAWVHHLGTGLDVAYRRLLAQWCLAETLDRATFCEATGTSYDALDEALQAAVRSGLVAADATRPGDVPRLVRDEFARSLPPDQRSRTHLDVARALTRSSPSGLVDAAHHLERAGNLVPREEWVDIMDRAGASAMAAGDQAEAERLARLAATRCSDAALKPRRVLLRSRASRAAGRWAEADERAHEAATAAAQQGQTDLMAEAALELALPADWRPSNPSTQHLLEDALAAGPSAPWQVQLMAALALQRFQVPRSADDAHRWSLHYRPDLAQPLADEALERARQFGDDDALVTALLVWRSVYRQPEHLHRRRESSAEALSLAVRRRTTTAMVEAAVRLAVDELEAAQRDGFEHAAAMARWAADQASEPRLLWRAHLLEATRALLDGDLAALERARRRALRAGRQAGAPGREATELILDRHVLALTDGWSVVAALDPHVDWPLVHHPLGVAGAAEGFARSGRLDMARTMLGRLRWPADPSTSMLLVTTLAARTAVLCRDVATARSVLPTLVTFSEHVAVDFEALWVEGPVASVGADVAELLGDDALAAELLERSRRLNGTLGCARTAAALEVRQPRGQDGLSLPDREHAVLRLLADGLGNAQIATVLEVSVATVRRETSSLYQRLGTSNRAGAVAKAHELGLL